MSPEALKRKTSPSPLPLARDVGAPARPLAPLRRAAIPRGMAGLLSAAAAAAMVTACADPPCPAPGAAGDMRPVSPPTAPAPVAPASITPPEPETEGAQTSAPVPTTTPAAITAPSAAPTTAKPPKHTAKPPKHIEPTPKVPKLGGKPPFD